MTPPDLARLAGYLALVDRRSTMTSMATALVEEIDALLTAYRALEEQRDLLADVVKRARDEVAALETERDTYRRSLQYCHCGESSGTANDTGIQSVVIEPPPAAPPDAAAILDYLQGVPCSPFCSPMGLHVNYCVQSVIQAPGFRHALTTPPPDAATVERVARAIEDADAHLCHMGETIHYDVMAVAAVRAARATP